MTFSEPLQSKPRIRVWYNALDMKIKVVVEPGEDGYFVARVPALKGCWSQGQTREEALKNVREAIDLYLEPEPDDFMPITGREIVELAI